MINLEKHSKRFSLSKVKQILTKNSNITRNNKQKQKLPILYK